MVKCARIPLFFILLSAMFLVNSSVFTIAEVVPTQTPAKSEIPEVVKATSKLELLAPVRVKGFGLVNLKGELVLGRVYQGMKEFSEGLAAVMEDGKWGFIDIKGTFVIPAQFDKALSFENGTARVRIGDCWGIVKANGEYLLNPNLDKQYIWLSKFTEGVCAAKNRYGKWTYFSEKGKPARLGKYDHAMPFSEGLAAVMLLKGDSELWGFINHAGQYEIEPIYDRAGSFKCGLAAVRRGYYMGYVKNDGTPAVPFAFYSALSFSEGFAPVEFSGKWGYIDKNCEIAIEPYYDFAAAFSEGFAVVGQRNKKKMLYGIVDSTGREVVPLVLESLKTMKNGMIPGQRDKLWGLVGKENQILHDFFYDSIERFSDDLFLIEFKSKWGLMDSTGKILVYPDFKRLYRNDEKSAIVEFDGTGFIDTKGSLVVRPVFDSAFGFSQGSAAVSIDRKWGLIDAKGKLIFEPSWSAPLKLQFNENLTPTALENNLHGFIDPTGKTIIDGRFKFASGFSNGVAVVRGNDGWGVINRSGFPIVLPKYWEARTFPTGLIFARDRYLVIIFDSEGKQIQKIAREQLGKIPGQYFLTVTTNSWNVLTKSGMNYTNPLYISEDFYSEGLLPARLSDSGKFGFIDRNGKIAILPKFDYCGHFSQGLCAVKINGKWGYIDKVGAEIIPAKYMSALEFSEDVAPVKLQPVEKAGTVEAVFINKAGEVVISDGYLDAKPFFEKRAAVSKGGKWALINTEGNNICDFLYDYIGEFSNGIAPFKIGVKWGYMDLQGKVVISAAFESCGAFKKVESDVSGN